MKNMETVREIARGDDFRTTLVSALLKQFGSNFGHFGIAG
jgi:hypothetical protein